MIYPIIYSFVLLPGNILLFALLTMFMVNNKNLKLDVPQKIFIGLMGWIFVGCLFSNNILVALVGFVLRSEGFVIWLIMARIAYLVWKDEYSFCQVCLGIATSFVICMTIGVFFPKYPINHLALGGYSAIGFVYLWSIYPEASVLAVPTLIMAGSRASLASMATGVIVCFLLKVKTMKTVKIAVVISVVMAVAIYFSPFGQKIKNLNLNVLGSGCRSELIMQADKLDHRLPIFGIGLDSMYQYLTPPASKTFQENSIIDKTHNIAYDIILQTGWIGYTACLMIFGACIWITINYRTESNVSCLSAMSAWIVFGMINPQGCPAHLLMLIALFGIRRGKDEP